MVVVGVEVGIRFSCTIMVVIYLFMCYIYYKDLTYIPAVTQNLITSEDSDAEDEAGDDILNY